MKVSSRRILRDNRDNMNQPGVVILVFLVFANVAHGLYPSSSDVVDLTPANFDRLVKQSDNVWVVEFYAPWCGHCKSLVPEYSKAATALKGVVKIGAINADEHQSLAQEFKVQGFPTLKIFGHNKNAPEDYKGGRTASEIIDGAMKAARAKVDSQFGGKSGKFKQKQVMNANQPKAATNYGHRLFLSTKLPTGPVLSNQKFTSALEKMRKPGIARSTKNDLFTSQLLNKNMVV